MAFKSKHSEKSGKILEESFGDLRKLQRQLWTSSTLAISTAGETPGNISGQGHAQTFGQDGEVPHITRAFSELSLKDKAENEDTLHGISTMPGRLPVQQHAQTARLGPVRYNDNCSIQPDGDSRVSEHIFSSSDLAERWPASRRNNQTIVEPVVSTNLNGTPDTFVHPPGSQPRAFDDSIGESRQILRLVSSNRDVNSCAKSLMDFAEVPAGYKVSLVLIDSPWQSLPAEKMLEIKRDLEEKVPGLFVNILLYPDGQRDEECSYITAVTILGLLIADCWVSENSLQGPKSAEIIRLFNTIVQTRHPGRGILDLNKIYRLSGEEICDVVRVSHAIFCNFFPMVTFKNWNFTDVTSVFENVVELENCLKILQQSESPPSPTWIAEALTRVLKEKAKPGEFKYFLSALNKAIQEHPAEIIWREKREKFMKVISNALPYYFAGDQVLMRNEFLSRLKKEIQTSHFHQCKRLFAVNAAETLPGTHWFVGLIMAICGA